MATTPTSRPKTSALLGPSSSSSSTSPSGTESLPPMRPSLSYLASSRRDTLRPSTSTSSMNVAALAREPHRPVSLLTMRSGFSSYEGSVPRGRFAPAIGSVSHVSLGRSPSFGSRPLTRRLTQGVLVQEVDEGQPCLMCRDKCPGYTSHTWRRDVFDAHCII
ncbi:uncharacterized protein LOC143033221 [Oratosquilla oratoria]|uniref:uncharacterized protein LOC143033221 n=1 Tax=Oratosquilla oratoria TaxID=337810 RepID=UPI003F75B9FD